MKLTDANGNGTPFGYALWFIGFIAVALIIGGQS